MAGTGQIGVSGQIVFSADPGAFQCDFQECDIDVAANFVLANVANKLTVAVATSGGTFVARLDFTVRAGFVRPNWTIQTTNAVNILLKIGA